MLIGALVGLFNGVAVTRIGINPLIATLGTLSIARGLSFVFSGGLTQTIDSESFGFLGRGFVFGVPFQVIVMAILFVIAAFVMRATVFRALDLRDWRQRASEPTGRFAGAKFTNRGLLIVGFGRGLRRRFSGVAVGRGRTGCGCGHRTQRDRAVILGGSSLSGGKGTIGGTLLGVLILGTLNNGLTLLNVSSYYQEIARGVVLLLAVGLDQLRLRWSQRG